MSWFEKMIGGWAARTHKAGGLCWCFPRRVRTTFLAAPLFRRPRVRKQRRDASRLRIQFLQLAVACLFVIAGCVARPVKFYNMVVEIEKEKEGEWYVVEEVGQGDVCQAAASFVWDYEGGAGTHTFRWELYQEGQLIQRGKEYRSSFSSSPFKVILTLDTSALKLGECEFILYLDGKEVGRKTTKVVKRIPK